MPQSAGLLRSPSLQRKICVIIVDDDEDDRHFIHRAFQNVGAKHQILQYEDGEKLMKSLTESEDAQEKIASCGLIILDVNMHRMSGIEVLQAIKGNPLLKHIPTVMLSTSIEEDLVQEAYSLGANGYLQKPNLMDDYNHLVISMQACFLEVPSVRWSQL
ncbi:response regulator [Larkinella arboricola]|uniref:CheY-like chemotaxis protein n=1 Tax=Larkinella arboricola TaxID=643671 RepID=A0A327WS79_LARAB|nr:response regulator [Larkinella arboricola]RAJ95478.1 CheY-like chemotaxis protein [Larkinella arboricola]